MTRQQTGVVMDALRCAYPQFYRGMSEKENKNALNLWATLFKDDDAEVVRAAATAFIACDTKGFPPHIGEIKAYMGKIRRPGCMTEQEAWALVIKAVGNSAYDSVKEFNGLPPDLKSLVDSPRQLFDWCLMDSGQVNSVVASNFMRSYRARAELWRQETALPEDVKRFIGKIADSMALKELTADMEGA